LTRLFNPYRLRALILESGMKILLTMEYAVYRLRENNLCASEAGER